MPDTNSDSLRLAGRLRSGLLLVSVLLLGLAAGAGEAGAQEASHEGTRIEIGPAYGNVQGDDFDGIGWGVGGELQLRRAWSSGWSLGVAGRYTLHEASDVEDRLALINAALEPRYTFDADGLPFDPVFGGRAGFTRWDLTVRQAGVSADFAANGLEVGGTAGARFGLSESVDLEIRGVASLITYDDVTSEVEGSSLFQDGTFPRSGTLGAYFGVQGALTLPFP